MFLHDIDYDKFNIALGDTLLEPAHIDDEPFEVIVSNPPYSINWVGDDDPKLINDPRFAPAGILAPKNNADYAFIMHALSWLSTSGTAAIVCFPGILHRSNTKAEPKIRQYLIDNNYIDAIIQLPKNIFFGTQTDTAIMVLKKNKKDNKTLFIDASNEYVKITNNNKLEEQNIQRILDWYLERNDVEHAVRLVDNNEIVGNKYILSVSTYVKPDDTREPVDIKKLNDDIETMVKREQELRDKIKQIIKDIEG